MGTRRDARPPTAGQRRLAADTSQEAETVYLSRLREAGAGGRLAAAAGMVETAHLLMRAGLSRRYPQEGLEGQHMRLVELWWGSIVSPEIRNGYRVAYQTRGEGTADVTTALDALLEVIRILEALGIPYLLGGSWAMLAHGIPRATQDADLLVELAPHKAALLIAALEESFYVSPEAVQEALLRHSSFNVIPLGVAFKIDIFVAADQPYERTELSRGMPHQIGGATGPTVVVATPEDSVLTKLRWYRQGGEQSERQWEDVLGVLKVQGEALDRTYLRHWATALHVSDLLTRALLETGLADDRALS
jgi:hypothetical protein